MILLSTAVVHSVADGLSKIIETTGLAYWLAATIVALQPQIRLARLSFEVGDQGI
jgi:hypothetical protein